MKSSIAPRPALPSGPLFSIASQLRHLLLLGAFLLALLASAAAQEFTLDGVRVLGSKRFAENEITTATGLKLGEPISVAALSQAASRLADTGLFTEVTFRYETLGTGMTVYFNLKDGPALLPCRFENFVWANDAELIVALKKRVTLFNGRVPTTGRMTDRVAAGLQQLLQARGFSGEIEQRLYTTRVGGPIEAVSFVVKGVAMPIEVVELPGASPAILPLLNEPISRLKSFEYQRSVLENYAFQNFSTAYYRRGYLRVGFSPPQVRLLAAQGNRQPVAVTIPVTEGAQYTLADLTFAGYREIQADELKKHVRARLGGIIDAVQLQDDVEGLRKFYGTHGYLHAATRAEPQIDDDRHTVAFTISVNEGDQYRMGTLEVKGLDEAGARAVMNAWRLKAGDPFDNSYSTRFMEDVRGVVRSSRPFKYKVNQREQPDKTVNVTLVFTSS